MKISGYPAVLQLAKSPVQHRQRIVQQIAAEIYRLQQLPWNLLRTSKAPMAAPKAPIRQPNPNDRVTLSILAIIASRGWYDNR